MIVLCGSAMSFIEKELLAEKNPLYGRATGIYKMTEMGFYEAARFFPDYSAKDKVLAYAVLGGILHYLGQFNPGLSVEENIKRNILTKGAVLYSEAEFLLHQELRETPVYNSIIEAVALGNTKLNDISQKSLVENTSKTSVYLRNLIELGIVRREFSVDTGTKERANTNRGTYRLTDNFFRFWYAFGFANPDPAAPCAAGMPQVGSPLRFPKVVGENCNQLLGIGLGFLTEAAAVQLF